MTEVDATRALTVECPWEGGCGAPAGTPCRTSYADGVHAERIRLADLRSLERGTCALCHQPMVRGSVEGSPVTAWHPDPADHGCPPMPDPRTDWDGYALLLQQGLQPGYPGAEHFVPAIDTQQLADAVSEAFDAGGGIVDLDSVAANQPVAVEVGVLCPECDNGKHQNCDGRGLHPVTDELVPCTCTHGAPA